jgi:hypothetical protein
MDVETVQAVAAHAAAMASHTFEAVPLNEHGEPVIVRSTVGNISVFISAVLASLVKQGVELVLRDSRPDSYYDYHCSCAREHHGQEPRSHKRSGDPTLSKKKNYTDTSKFCDCMCRLRVAYHLINKGWKVTHINSRHSGHYPRQYIPPTFTDEDKAVVDQWKDVHGMTMSTIMSLLRMQGVFTTPTKVRLTRIQGVPLV